MKEFKIIRDLPTIGYVFKQLYFLDNYYPNFNNWFWDKLVPDILLGTDEIITLFNKNELIGISIIKKQDERKLRAVRVMPKYSNKGYGLYLIDEALKRLEVDKPLCTVPEELLHDFSRIFINRYNFDISKVEKGLYRKNKLEYIFNKG